MDAKTIDILTALDPSSRIPKVTVAGARAKQPGSPLHAQAMEAFLSMYARLGFGHYIANQFATRRLPFPIPMTKRNAWVFKAYLMKLDPFQFHNKHISDAFHMAHSSSDMPQLGGGLKALLMSFDGNLPSDHISRVASRTGIPRDTVEAFEALHYNVLDRRMDAMYISNEVYPNTRIVEFDDAYFQNSSLGDLLKRAGYNYRDLDLTAYLLGIGDRTYMAKIAASDNREAELTKHIMGNGLILSRTNLLNQRSVGLSRSSTLLAASRQGGTTAEEPTLSVVSGGFGKQLKDAVSMAQSNTVRMMRADAGYPIIDIPS